jgi:hypothetical protein
MYVKCTKYWSVCESTGPRCESTELECGSTGSPDVEVLVPGRGSTGLDVQN